MIRVVYGAGFPKSLRRLPQKVQNDTVTRLVFLRENPFYPLLHTKHLAGELAGLLSFRVARDY